MILENYYGMNSINRNIFIINKKSIIINIFCGLLKIICSYYSIMANLESMVIDLNPDDKSVINIADKPSVNFGGGIELLMNDKKKGGSTEIGIGELSELENDLNNLSDDIGKKSLENSRSAIFNESINKFNTTSNTDNQTPMEVKFSDLKDNINNTSGVGIATADAYNDSKTWDGYGKFSNIPVTNNEPQLSKEELIREKFKYLRRLEDLENKGANLTKKYTMESSLSEMQGEYEMIIAEKEKSNSVKFQGRMLMAAVTGLEFLNGKFDPFDLKMDGWAEQVNENIDDYDEIFGELHEKYKSKAKMAPELKLLFQLGGSAIMVHMTNTMFKSAIPGMDDIMKQNPELMQQFTQAAVNSMGDNNPGFSNFMSNFMPNSNSGPPPNVPNMGPPPPSVNTQINKSQRYAPPANRPDLQASRIGDGISIEEKFSNLNSDTSINTPATYQSKRPDMKGPSDISDLLSGLKTKEVNVKPVSNEKDPSTISIKDLKELNNQKPPKSNRKPKSSRERNTISLDL